MKHTEIKKLITDGHMIDYQVMPKWKGFFPALVIYFDNHKPVAIRRYKWEEYWDILDKAEEVR